MDLRSKGQMIGSSRLLLLSIYYLMVNCYHMTFTTLEVYHSNGNRGVHLNGDTSHHYLHHPLLSLAHNSHPPKLSKDACAAHPSVVYTEF